MAFVYRSEKNTNFSISKEDDINSKNKLLKEIKNISQKAKLKYESLNRNYIPFLSRTEKFIEKTISAPGPGSYDLEKTSENFIHKQYIKYNSIKYKHSLYDLYSLFHGINLKNLKKPSPGPGQYNPGEFDSFGSKIKKEKNNRKNQSYSLYNFFPKNIKKINENNHNKKKKTENNYDINIIKKKKVQSYTIRELFRNLIENQKIRNKIYEHNNNSSNNIDMNNKINNSNLNQNKYIKSTNCQASKTNTTNYLDKSKILRNNQIIKRLKERTPKNNISITSEIQESNYYLNEFLNSKIFAQPPGPGYYYIDPYSKIMKKTSNKSHSMLIISKNKNKKKINQYIESNKNEKIKQNIKKSKTFNELQSDLIKQKSQKEKKVYLKNKRTKLLEKIMEKLNQKKYDEENSVLYDDVNNNQEIQEYGYPIKYTGNKNTDTDLKVFNTSEIRFKGPLGYQNEIYKNINPGPGNYEMFNINSIYKKNENIIENYSCKNKIHNEMKYRASFLDEIKNNNPPVGSYQSQLHNTIEFKNLMIRNKLYINPIKNGFSERIKAITDRKVQDLKYKEKKSNSMLGPCSYFNESDFDKKEKRYNKDVCFGSNLEKNFKINKNSEIGPGDYNIDKNQNWIKKSYNIHFV